MSDIRGDIYNDIVTECRDILRESGGEINTYISQLIDDFIIRHEREIFEIRDKDVYKEFLCNSKQLINDRIITDREIEELSFVELFQRSKRWLDFYKRFKSKKMRIVVFGKTQVGKTATIKNIFNLKNLKLGGNVESDTFEIKEYTTVINDIELILVDTPGYFDSKRRDTENFANLKKYFSKNEVHLILWFTKINDIIDSNEQDISLMLKNEFGETFWKHTIVILTHANDPPPQEYFLQLDKGSGTDTDDENCDLTQCIQCDDDDVFDLGDYEIVNTSSYKLKLAWKKYVERKAEMWHKHFRKMGSSYMPEIVLIENNRYHPNNRVSIDGDRLLIDDRPMWESLMLSIIESVADEIKPFAFMVLAGNINNQAFEKKRKVLTKAAVRATKNVKKDKCCVVM